MRVTEQHVVAARLRAAGCVFAEDEAALLSGAARTPVELAELVARRVAGVPLEQILGWTEFCGRRIVVEPGVFVPRRRSELLVRAAAALLGAVSRRRARAGGAPRTVVVDLCCGSGALGAALAAAVDAVELHAVDIAPAAVACARRNVGGAVYEGDLYEPLPASLRARVDLVVANVPYVPTAEIARLPPEARLYEPRIALDGGADGLTVVRRVSAEAPLWLAPGGRLLVEASKRQVPAVCEIFTRAGLCARVVVSGDLEATVVSARRPARARRRATGR
ncbi:MAG: putative protein N(5)-glutamine methyltransferase [Vulcanimicrobiaceae bacterium]